jgi:hypothetical protein
MEKEYETKGSDGEEALRTYFREAGYFAVRGVPFQYKTHDVTDVDLWLYIKSTSLSRERTCVDVKRKKNPQAMERVFWTKGLRDVLRLERAIVVTSDNRRAVREFGAINGVTVLLGDFLQRVISGYNRTERITEEEFWGSLKGPCIVNKNILWPRWYRGAKSTLIDGLDFNTCNQFLSDIHLLLQEHIAAGNRPHIIRLLYLVISYFLVSLDFTIRSFGQMELNERKAILIEGLRYGEAGPERAREVIDTALTLIEGSGKADSFTRIDIRKEFQEQLNFLPAEILSDYFSRGESLKALFDLARDFESDAYATNLVQPPECRSEHKAIIGLLCDFCGIDRKKVI